MTDTREQKRNKAANKVCRELRYQIASNDHDWSVLCKYLTRWMNVAKKDKYARP